MKELQRSFKVGLVLFLWGLFQAILFAALCWAGSVSLDHPGVLMIMMYGEGSAAVTIALGISMLLHPWVLEYLCYGVEPDHKDPNQENAKAGK